MAKKKKVKKCNIKKAFIAHKKSGEKMMSKESAEMLGYNNWNNLYGGLR